MNLINLTDIFYMSPLASFYGYNHNKILSKFIYLLIFTMK